MSRPTHLSLKRLCFGLISFVAFTLVLGEPVAAQQQQPSAFSKVVQKANPANWKIPSFRLPNFLVPHDEQDRIVTRKNGLFQDVKDTTSRSWQRTKQTFNPARLNPMNLFAGPSGGTTTPNDADKPGFFSSLLSAPAPEPAERVASVNEFLGQQRP